MFDDCMTAIRESNAMNTNNYNIYDNLTYILSKDQFEQSEHVADVSDTMISLLEKYNLKPVLMKDSQILFVDTDLFGSDPRVYYPKEYVNWLLRKLLDSYIQVWETLDNGKVGVGSYATKFALFDKAGLVYSMSVAMLLIAIIVYYLIRVIKEINAGKLQFVELNGTIMIHIVLAYFIIVGALRMVSFANDTQKGKWRFGTYRPDGTESPMMT